MEKEKYSVDSFYTKHGKLLHNMKSLFDCINDNRIIDVAWLDKPSMDKRTVEYKYGEEVVNVSFVKDDGKKGFLNLSIPFDEFDKTAFIKWISANREKVWKGNYDGYKIRGIDYL